MSKMGNPNPSGAKPDKLIRDALKAAIRQDPKKLKKMAEAIIDKACEGDTAAFKEVADRIDGKVAQAIVNDDENPFVVINRIERVVIDSQNGNA
jgi:hypothetical protein